jgi:hypothetical protein
MLFWARLSWATVSPDTSYLFYRPLDYGSMSMVTPWNVVLNGSFDVLQLDGQDRRLGALAYANGATNVWHNIIRPGRAIDRLGFWKWVRTEVLPLDFTREGGQWLPNYQLHLIGGGMHYRLLKEWFHAHGVDAPGVWSAGTIAVYHVLNEVVENNAYRGANTDPIADLLLFDIAGPLLFSIDDVATFFARDLQMSDWSHIPVITLPEGRLGNNGLYYAMKWTLPGQDRWSLFYLMGMSNMAGASLKVDSEHSITMAVGARGRRLVDVDPTIHLKTLELVPTGGVFWDRNNSLLASLTASGQADQTIIAHVYPGLVRIGPLQPAFYASWGSSGSVGVGMALRATPGFGWRNR